MTREEALKTLECLMNEGVISEHFCTGYRLVPLEEQEKTALAVAISALKGPERKHGEWIYHEKADENNNISCSCSICHAGEVKSLDVIVPYCWKCGAIMDGKENRND